MKNAMEVLEALEDLFDDLEVDNPTAEQLQEMYGIYLNDFVYTPLFYSGKKVVINPVLIKDKRDGYFVNKQKTFDHIVTRDNKYSNKRQYDKERANKIHWLRPIIENHECGYIKKFEKKDQEGRCNIFLWYESKNYIVILREKEPELFLVTGYCVDEVERRRFKKEYEVYRDKKTPLRK